MKRLVVVLALLFAALPARAVKIAADEDTFADLRLLLQAWGQLTEDGAPDGESLGKDLYLRRIRIVVSGQVSERIGVFFDTDAVDFGKDDFSGRVFVQDAFAWFRVAEPLFLDVGLFYTPFLHNSIQGAPFLMTADFRGGAFRFPPSANVVRRDVGAQARGLVLDDRIQFRGGVFKGVRGAPEGAEGPTAGLNPGDAVRLAGTVRFNFLEPEPDFMLQGIYLGKRRVLSIGLAGDWQQEAARDATGQLADFGALGVDLFADIPFAGGDQEVVVQAAVMNWEAGEESPNTGASYYVEAGYRYREVMPYVAWERFDAEAAADAGDFDAVRFGGAWWIEGHQANLKLEAARIEQAAADAFWQGTLQVQLFL